MTANVKLLFYLEDDIVNRSSRSGISSAYHLPRRLLEKLPRFIAYIAHPYAQNNTLEDTIYATTLEYAIAKISARLPLCAAIFLSTFYALLVYIRIKRLVSAKIILFAPVGCNILNLYRAFVISKLLGGELTILLVDLIEEHPQNIKTNKIVSFYLIKYILDHIHKSFFITQGLKNHFLNRYGLNENIFAGILEPLNSARIDPINKKVYKESRLENQVFFLGSINELYIEGLQEISRIIKLYNSTNNDNLKLCVINQKMNIKLDDSILRVIERPNNAELERICSTSLMCFMPYSFNYEYKSMISTSYPSKLTTYLEFSSFIVAVGPQESTVALEFRRGRLPYYYSSYSDLRNTFNYLLKQAKDQNNRKTLKTYYISQLLSKPNASVLIDYFSAKTIYEQ